MFVGSNLLLALAHLCRLLGVQEYLTTLLKVIGRYVFLRVLG